MVVIVKNIKKIISVVIVLLLLIAAATPALAGTTPAFEKAMVTADGVNVRLAPSVDAPVVTALYVGMQVGVLGEEDGWYRVVFGNYRGYISADFIYLPATDLLTGSPVADETPVYATADDKTEAIDQLNTGAAFTVIETDGAYYSIAYSANANAQAQDAEGETENGEEDEATRSIAREEGQAAEGEDEQPEEGQDPAEEAQAGEEGEEATLEATAQDTAADGLERGYIRRDAVKLAVNKNAVATLQEGMMGAAVLKMQTELRRRGFLEVTPSGQYGLETGGAVARFQEFAGLTASGTADENTLAQLYADNGIVCDYASTLGISGQVQLLAWEEVDASYIADGSAFTVTDVYTGVSWSEQRMGGEGHVNCAPLTAEDTALMQQATGNWSWERRPVWVTAGDVIIAASMVSMPHMESDISGNSFNGHHCIHFYGSQIDETEEVCPLHAAQVQYAYKAGNRAN